MAVVAVENRCCGGVKRGDGRSSTEVEKIVPRLYRVGGL